MSVNIEKKKKMFNTPSIEAIICTVRGRSYKSQGTYLKNT